MWPALIGAEGVHHNSYHVPIIHSFYTHIHKNLTFKNRISCCLVKTLHSIVPGIGSPVCPAGCFGDVVATAPYSNHNEVMSVTIQAIHKPSQLLSCLHHFDQQKEIPQWNKRQFLQGSQPKKVLKVCMYVTKV
jgi:hypothetical protein